MYLIEISTPQTAYVYDTQSENGTAKGKIVGIFSAFDAKKVVRLLNRERYGESPQRSNCKQRYATTTKILTDAVSVSLVSFSLNNQPAAVPIDGPRHTPFVI